MQEQTRLEIERLRELKSIGFGFPSNAPSAILRTRVANLERLACELALVVAELIGPQGQDPFAQERAREILATTAKSLHRP